MKKKLGRCFSGSQFIRKFTSYKEEGSSIYSKNITNSAMAPSSQYSARGFYLRTETGGNAEATPINESSRTQYKKNKYNIDCEKCSIVTTRKDINRLIEDLERRTHG